jgi:hypothetical protein
MKKKTINQKIWWHLYCTLTSSQIEQALRDADCTHADWMKFLDDMKKFK